jgi:methionyl-tRNA synthetase
MIDQILIAVAWPYANGPLHAGHLAGAYLPADIFARYQRLKGRNVLMLSGSDCHGTPITLQAGREGLTPQQLIRKNHEAFLKSFLTLGIGFDLFTQTFTDNHYATTQEFFLTLLENNYLYRDRTTGSYSESLSRFLPDRFIEGTCPHCGFTRARGDQCDNCGRLLEPAELVAPHSTIDGGAITFRDTEHFVLDLAKLEPSLRQWLDGQDHSHWRANTLLATQNWLREGLHGRAITRDLEWGVPVPVDDPAFREKRIYVWFDAVIGYYSATKEWAQLHGQDEQWREWWDPEKTRSYYFIGKDNIPFHTIIWPAILLGSGIRGLPYDVAANEFLNYEGEKMSTSRNWALWAHDIQERYDPDAIRYYLAANAPEGRDTSWYATDFVRRNNDELVATWGNLANRVLTIAHRHFGCVPQPAGFRQADTELLSVAHDAFGKVGESIDRVELKSALQQVMSLATRANQYVTGQEPWRLVKESPERAATVLYVSLQVVDHLSTLFSPFLPFSCERLREYLGYDKIEESKSRLVQTTDPDRQLRTVLVSSHAQNVRWEPRGLAAGQTLTEPQPLFRKL